MQRLPKVSLTMLLLVCVCAIPAIPQVPSSQPGARERLLGGSFFQVIGPR